MTSRLNEYVEFPRVRPVLTIRWMVSGPKGKKPDSVETATVLDNPHAFDDDGYRIRCGHGRKIMVCMRRLALTLLRY